MADKEGDHVPAEETPMPESDQNQPEQPHHHQEDQAQPPPPEEIKKPEKTASNISFNIWPPSQRTRDAVINRLVETLSTPSVLSKRYGSVPQDEAASVARVIEQDSFSAASDAATSTAGDDGIEILQVYSKEISKLMLDAIKARSAASSGSTSDHDASSHAPPVAAPAAREEISSVESES
ncbi:MFP1 attachment factor 1-like [Malania oleifera]|uniref:MFP1 attachment factor 1-like n=1 Tax=Malania oleifera TaxID=397392 RepID=UPI0025ADD598|nr:MFP1 attachment factor 1-like [Malania oleifera]